MNRYALLADLVVIVHAAFVVFVVSGGLLALRWPRVAWAHFPAFVWGSWIELSGAICPLTPLEQHWRQLAGQAGYTGGFIEHYLEPILYPVGLTRSVQVWLGIAALGGNAVVYVVLWTRRVRRARSRGRPAGAIVPPQRRRP